MDPKYRKIAYVIGAIVGAVLLYKVFTKWVIRDINVKFPAVVYTSAGFCGYCKEFKPMWERLKKKGIKTQDGMPIQFIELSAGDAMLEKFPPVDSYPTIRYHYSYANYAQFEGQRSDEALIEFINASSAQRESYTGVAVGTGAPAVGKPGAPTDPAQQSVVGAPGSASAMVPATVPSGPASGPSLIANRASYSMYSDKEYVPPSRFNAPSKKDCKKETKCPTANYFDAPSSLGSGINTQAPLFYNGGYLDTNLTSKTIKTARFPKETGGGVYLVEHW